MNDDASGVGHYYAQRSPQDGRLCVSKRTTRTRNAAWQLLRNLLMAFCGFVWNVDAKKMDCVKKKKRHCYIWNEYIGPGRSSKYGMWNAMDDQYIVPGSICTLCREGEVCRENKWASKL